MQMLVQMALARALAPVGAGRVAPTDQMRLAMTAVQGLTAPARRVGAAGLADRGNRSVGLAECLVSVAALTATACRGPMIFVADRGDEVANRSLNLEGPGASKAARVSWAAVVIVATAAGEPVAALRCGRKPALVAEAGLAAIEVRMDEGMLVRLADRTR
jgi:hypothetical protein